MCRFFREKSSAKKQRGGSFSDSRNDSLPRLIFASKSREADFQKVTRAARELLASAGGVRQASLFEKRLSEKLHAGVHLALAATTACLAGDTGFSSSLAAEAACLACDIGVSFGARRGDSPPACGQVGRVITPRNTSALREPLSLSFPSSRRSPGSMRSSSEPSYRISGRSHCPEAPRSSRAVR